MIVFQFGTASAVFWVYGARFILPFRPLSSPMLRIAPVAKPRIARHMREPVRRSVTSAALPNVGSTLDKFLAVATSVPMLSLRRSGVWHFEGQPSWTW
jgi:hypothetical protein